MIFDKIANLRPGAGKNAREMESRIARITSVQQDTDVGSVDFDRTDKHGNVIEHVHDSLVERWWAKIDGHEMLFVYSYLAPLDHKGEHFAKTETKTIRLAKIDGNVLSDADAKALWDTWKKPLETKLERVRAERDKILDEKIRGETHKFTDQLTDAEERLHDVVANEVKKLLD